MEKLLFGRMRVINADDEEGESWEIVAEETIFDGVMRSQHIRIGPSLQQRNIEWDVLRLASGPTEYVPKSNVMAGCARSTLPRVTSS